MTAHQPDLPGPHHVRLIFLGLMVAMLAAALDQTIFSTALPTIVGELHGLDAMQWVTTAYLGATTITMPIYGKFSDLVGRRPLFVAALSIFVAGSVIGALAPTMGVLIVARTVQGLGGGGLMVLSQAIVADVVPLRDRGRYMGAIGAMFGVSSVAGPLLGGFFTTALSWRWAFWINVPLAGLAIVVAAVFLRLPTRPGHTRIDVAGIASMAVSVTALILFTSWGGTTYAWTSPVILGLIIVAVIAGAVFVLAERRAAEPILPLYLLANREFLIATVAGLALSISMFGAMAYLPTYLQMVEGFSPTVAGLLMIPMTAGLLITATMSGSLVSRTGRYKTLLLVGSPVTAVSLFLLSTASVDTPLWLLGSYLFGLGLGVGFGIQTFTLVVQLAFPDEVGTATAANTFFRQIGASLGSALVGTAFTVRLTRLLADRLGTAGSRALDPQALTPELIRSLAAPVRAIVVGAYHDALMPIYLALVPLAVVGLAAVSLIREQRLPAAAPTDPEPALAQRTSSRTGPVSPAARGGASGA